MRFVFKKEAGTKIPYITGKMDNVQLWDTKGENSFIIVRQFPNDGKRNLNTKIRFDNGITIFVSVSDIEPMTSGPCRYCSSFTKAAKGKSPDLLCTKKGVLLSTYRQRNYKEILWGNTLNMGCFENE